MGTFTGGGEELAKIPKITPYAAFTNATIEGVVSGVQLI